MLQDWHYNAFWRVKFTRIERIFCSFLCFVNPPNCNLSHNIKKQSPEIFCLTSGHAFQLRHCASGWQFLEIWLRSEFHILFKYLCTALFLLLNRNALFRGQLNSEWIDEVIVSPKRPMKNYQDFCPGSLLEGREEILVIFGWHFGRNDDLINSFWI